MSSRGRVRVEPGSKRIRVAFGGQMVADTTAPLLVWEKPHYPVYYLPIGDVRTEFLAQTGSSRSPSRGEAVRYTVSAGGASAPDAAYRHPDSPIEEIRGHIAFDWDAMDHWFEENEEVYVHARDPYTRVDVLRSSRHVRVEIDGVTVADSTRPTLLFETGLPVRFYLPKTDVRPDLLRPGTTTTRCPYKGTASYHSVEVNGVLHEDVIWTYPFPAAEAAGIAGLLAFYDDRVDVFVDGERWERPPRR
ncbi:MAG: DUF427 domain-containing protein [Actinomycetota bacterium]